MKSKVKIGNKYNKLTVIADEGISNHHHFWKCRCDCGGSVVLRSDKFVTGNNKSCGCSSHGTLDLTGKKYNKLVLIKKIGVGKYGSVLWECACDCGKIIVASGSSVKRGVTKHCGCGLKKQRIKVTHKICSKCKGDKDASEFRATDKMINNLSSWCTKCINEQKKVKRAKKKEVWLILNPPPFDNAKKCTTCKEWFQNTTEFFHEIKSGKRKGKLLVQCIICSRKAKKEYYYENKELLTIRQKTYVENNKEKVLQRKHDYYMNNCDNFIVINKTYRDNNKEKLKEMYKKWRNTDKGRISCKIARLRYKLRKKNAGDLSSETIYEVLDESRTKKGHVICFYCGKHTGHKWHLEHKKPLSRGGTNVKENLAISCPFCNLSKGNKTPEEFEKWKRMISLSDLKGDHSIYKQQGVN